MAEVQVCGQSQSTGRLSQNGASLWERKLLGSVLLDRHTLRFGCGGYTEICEREGGQVESTIQRGVFQKS